MSELGWPLTRPSWTKEELAGAMARVMESGQLTQGPLVKEFEDEFAHLVGMHNARFVNSGSSANLLAIAALTHYPKYGGGLEPLRAGDEVLVPALAWSTTYAPLAQHGLRLRIVDIDPNTLNIDVNAVRKTITTRTRLIVVVNILGEPAELDQLHTLAIEHDCWLLEDNCESFGAVTPTGTVAGTYGHLGTFSTFFSHQLSTIEGGMVVTNNAVLADLVTCLRSHGWRRDLPEDSALLHEVTPPAFGAAYQFLLPGYNVRSTELHAALGLEQLPRLGVMQGHRRANVNLFQSLFAEHPHLQLQKMTPGGMPYSFVLIADTSERRAQAFSALDAVGIEYRPVTGGSFFQHPAYRKYDVYRSPTPNADHVHDCGFFVGNHACDLTEEINLLWQTLKDI